MIRVTAPGSFEKTNSFLNFLKTGRMFDNLDRYGRMGVDALSSATPIDTGETAESWGYLIKRTPGRLSLIWYNTHEQDGVNVAVIIQYGHATGNGSYIEGIDYVNPAMRSLLRQIADETWRQVTNA